jgi:trk system potassium uptake protein TrkH
LPCGGSSSAGWAEWGSSSSLIIGGTNFALLYLGIIRRRPVAFLRDIEFRVYLLLLALISFVIFAELASERILTGEAAVRHAVFNTASVMTTTGFASTDFNLWTSLTTFVLIGAMFVSASAGSTAGGIKLVRHIAIAKMMRREFRQTVHPELVAPIRINNVVIDERALRAIVVFAFVYVGAAAAGTFVILVDSAVADVSVAPFQALAAAATTLGNIGPGFGFAGPMGSFDPFNEFSKLAMIVLMWIGRIEIIPVLVLFTRGYWRV